MLSPTADKNHLALRIASGPKLVKIAIHSASFSACKESLIESIMSVERFAISMLIGKLIATTKINETARTRRVRANRLPIKAS